MSKYAFIDSNNVLAYTIVSEISPEEVPGFTIQKIDDDFYAGKAPSQNHVYDFLQKTWINPLSEKQKADISIKETKIKRSNLLQQSDWTDTVSAQTRLGSLYEQWQTYRQALRDITKQEGYPNSIVWPTPPQ